MDTIRTTLRPPIGWASARLDFESNPSHQTTIPEDPPVRPAIGPALGTFPGSRRKKRILVVDDDDQVLTSVTLVLEEEDYDVIMAGDGYEALIKCYSSHPDLVLMDLNMPRMDGWKTIEAIDRLAPLVPIIIITAKPQQYERAVGAGVDAFMEKPLDFPVLLDAVKWLLSESSKEHLVRITDRKFETLQLGFNRGSD